jgi:penicillin-binding protein 2
MYGRDFRCWKRGGHGTVQLHQALVHSCNVYFYTVGRALGIEEIHRYGDMLGLGRPTGVDLPGEASGVLPSDAWKRRTQGEPWYPGETISVSIGQGLLSVTPIQLVTMISAVATGKLPRPHLVSGQGGEPAALGISPSTLAAVRRALADVVDEGTGRRAGLEGISVAGKTGTAQVFKRSAGIDADKLPKEERDHAWFAGYAPAESPEIAFAIAVEHGGHGGTSAAPVARKVLEAHFAELLKPDEAEPKKTEGDATLRAGGGRPSEAPGVATASSR